MPKVPRGPAPPDKERVRVPKPLLKWRLPSGRGATEQPNAIGDGDAALNYRFWVALVITGAAALIVSVRVAFPVPLLLVALNVTVDVPAVVGVPEINPVPLFTVSPAGNPVAP